MIKLNIVILTHDAKMIIMITIIMLYMIEIHEDKYIYKYIYTNIYYTFIIPLFFSIINKPD